MSALPVGGPASLVEYSSGGLFGPLGPTAPAGPSGNFSQVLGNILGGASAQEAHADQAVRDFALGKTENVHDVMLAVTKADLTFRMLLEVRNRLTEAFQEIMRMQV